ncbi:GGDEF domain-containing protein [Pseudomonas sp. T]|uniref:diguanylate cyclase n=1 Tax=Pseudomonas denitrificans TaxID=43306 RepID=A0A9X7N4D0_PSEDE|nr:GGDEF domain-containing protein [Pseudomonas denitrificans (nom. rej.)]OQR31997.1 GGDEF domain-containing protein [Pseudomonas sp. T]QEY74719.1 GGDEF domain-containing protein [Pseudomonas denitrificans (nom. rej.)]
MSRDDDQRWKQKYLDNLEQQEKLERRWDARLDLLRRGLVRSSLAAEGSDKAVDACMKELREVLRRDEMDAGLSRLIPQLEKAVLDSEQRRQQRVEQNIAALGQLSQQLLSLDMPGDVRKPLKRLAKDIPSRGSSSRELPALLAELSRLQRQVLDHFGNGGGEQRPGFLQRLFGSRDNDDADLPESLPTAPAATAEAAPFDEVVVDEPVPAVGQPAAPAPAPAPAPAASAVAEAVAEPVMERAGALATAPAPEPVAALSPAAPGEAVAMAEVLVPARVAESVARDDSKLLDSLPVPPGLFGTPEDARQANDPYALPPRPEPGYSAVAPHIEASLLRLLDEMHLPAAQQIQAEELRSRIHGSLNWYELVPVLDDLGVLVLSLNDSGQREFEGYLHQLNERLGTFLDGLQAVQENHSGSSSSARDLDDTLREQVSGLKESVLEATDLEGLKRNVESRLQGLVGTMDRFREEREVREREVGERIQSLVTRVTSMEEEARTFQANIEDQRQKAMTDALTGLPNRAALSERLELEVSRWERYGGDLLLAVLDVDHFKRINDDFGHLAGDKVLKIIANELAKRVRKTDFIARYGGEEFVVLLPATPLDGGQQLLDVLRGAIEACPFHFKGERLSITCSAGLTAFREGERAEAVFERADQALYRAKRGGRNRLEVD